MSPQEANQLVAESKAILLDVREEEELRESGLANGAKWMPTSKICDCHPDWVALKASLPKNLPIIIYCRSGARSGRLAMQLAGESFQTVNLGGFCLWQEAKLPIVRLP